jgi:hypothetical protein
LHGTVAANPESPGQDASGDAQQAGYPQPSTGYPQGYPQVGNQAGQPYGMAPMPGGSAPPQRQPMDSALRLVITLMFVNLGLSVLTTIVVLILHNSVIDYQIAHTTIQPGVDVNQLRSIYQTSLWGRLAGNVVVSVLYVWRSFALRRGSRYAYLRTYYIAIIGLVGIAYLIFVSTQYPVWMRIEQVLQALVLLALLYAVSRPAVRARFAKQRA